MDGKKRSSIVISLNCIQVASRFLMEFCFLSSNRGRTIPAFSTVSKLLSSLPFHAFSWMQSRKLTIRILPSMQKHIPLVNSVHAMKNTIRSSISIISKHLLNYNFNGAIGSPPLICYYAPVPRYDVLYDIKGNGRRQREIIFRWIERGGYL